MTKISILLNRKLVKKVYFAPLKDQYFFVHKNINGTKICSLQNGFFYSGATDKEFKEIKEYVVEHGANWYEGNKSQRFFDFINKYDVFQLLTGKIIVDKFGNIVCFAKNRILTNIDSLAFDQISKMAFFIEGNAIGTVNTNDDDFEDMILTGKENEIGLLLKDLSDDQIRTFKAKANARNAHWVKYKLVVKILHDNINSDLFANETLGFKVPSVDIIYSTEDDPDVVSFGSDQQNHKFLIMYGFSGYSDLYKEYRLEANFKAVSSDLLNDNRSSYLTFEYDDKDRFEAACTLIKNLSEVTKKKEIRVPDDLQKAHKKIEQLDLRQDAQLEILIDNENYLPRPSLNELGLTSNNIMYIVDDFKHIKFANDLHDDEYVLYDYREHLGNGDREEHFFENYGYGMANYYDLKLYNSDNKKIKITIVTLVGSDTEQNTSDMLEEVFLKKGYIPKKKRVETSKYKIPVKELRELKSLFDDGIITQDEFDAKKKQLLNL